MVHWSVDIQPSRNPPVSVAGENVAGDCEAGVIAITTIGADDPTRVYDESAAARLFRVVHRYAFGSLLLLAIWCWWRVRRGQMRFYSNRVRASLVRVGIREVQAELFTRKVKLIQQENLYRIIDQVGQRFEPSVICIKTCGPAYHSC